MYSLAFVVYNRSFKYIFTKIFQTQQEEEKTDIREESTKVQVLELTRNRKVQILPKKCLIKEPYVWSEIFTDDPQNEGCFIIIIL